MSGKENVNENTKNIKMPFNKKKWREGRYKGEAKVKKWEGIRRKQTQRQFYKELKKINVNFDSKSSHKDFKLKEKKAISPFKAAQLKFQEIQRIKKEKRKEQKRIFEEKKEAMKAYKEKKALRFRKLSQKTKKGQPLMRARMQLLLEKIQKEYTKYNQTNSCQF